MSCLLKRRSERETQTKELGFNGVNVGVFRGEGPLGVYVVTGQRGGVVGVLRLDLVFVGMEARVTDVLSAGGSPVLAYEQAGLVARGLLAADVVEDGAGTGYRGDRGARENPRKLTFSFGSVRLEVPRPPEVVEILQEIRSVDRGFGWDGLVLMF